MATPSVVPGFVFPGNVYERFSIDTLPLKPLDPLDTQGWVLAFCFLQTALGVPDVLRHIAGYKNTTANLFQSILPPYTTEGPDWTLQYPDVISTFHEVFDPVMVWNLSDGYFNMHHYFDDREERSIAYYQYALAAVWYIYNQIDPLHQDERFKKILIQHLTCILHEVISTGARESVFELDIGLGRRLQYEFVWSHLEYYVTALVDGVASSIPSEEEGEVQDLSYPIFDILDSLCFDIAFSDLEEAIRCLRRFYYLSYRFDYS